jgi:hypothetical protein
MKNWCGGTHHSESRGKRVWSQSRLHSETLSQTNKQITREPCYSLLMAQMSLTLSKKILRKGAGNMAQMVVCLPSKFKALSSNPSSIKTKQNKKLRKGRVWKVIFRAPTHIPNFFSNKMKLNLWPCFWEKKGTGLKNSAQGKGVDLIYLAQLFGEPKIWNQMGYCVDLCEFSQCLKLLNGGGSTEGCHTLLSKREPGATQASSAALSHTCQSQLQSSRAVTRAPTGTCGSLENSFCRIPESRLPRQRDSGALHLLRPLNLPSVQGLGGQVRRHGALEEVELWVESGSAWHWEFYFLRCLWVSQKIPRGFDTFLSTV